VVALKTLVNGHSMKVVNIPSMKMMKKFFAQAFAKLATSRASSNSLYCAEAFSRHCDRSEAIHRAA